MDIILLERVEKLGHMGQLVTVKAGYARNYLLPQKKALRATKANLAHFEAQKAHLEAQNIKRRDEAHHASKAIEGVVVTLIRQAGETGHLYGSIRPKDIVDGLLEQKITVVRTQVLIEKPIKSLGIHEAKIVLHPEVHAMIKVNVALSMEEAMAQSENA